MIRLLGAALITLGFCGCTFSAAWLNRYRIHRAVATRDFPAALDLLEQQVNKEPNSTEALTASRLGAKIAHLDAKDYVRAVDFYRHIVLRSEDIEERRSSQKFIAQIYFENLLDYDRAVLEYEKLLKLSQRPGEDFRYRLNLAKSHLQLNNMNQALAEIDTLIKREPKAEELFEAKVLKATVLMSNKQLTEAAAMWRSILDEFPERSQKENVALNLVVCFEELKDFGKAIELLEGMREGYPNIEFLDLRIARLKERKANQPGAQGWRR